MRSQPIVLRLFCLVVVVVGGGGGVVVVDVVFVAVVVPNVGVVIQAMSKVDLRLLVKEVEFGWWWWGGLVGVGVQTHFHVKHKSVELS